VLSQLLAPMSR